MGRKKCILGQGVHFFRFDNCFIGVYDFSMVKVRIRQTGEVIQVDRNTAHTLVDTGKGDLVLSEGDPKYKTKDPGYVNRQMRPNKTS